MIRKLDWKFVTIGIALGLSWSLLIGCASYRATGELTQGRQALLRGEPERALTSFRVTAERYPERLYFSDFPEGSWTYVGRAAYDAKRYKEAREALERALALHPQDGMAQLYLGLTLARQGERSRGRSAIERGLRTINDWIERVHSTQRFGFGKYWDPRGEIRREIETVLNRDTRESFNWDSYLANVEAIGRRVEEEIDLARRDEQRDFSREGDNDGRRR